MHSIRVLIFLIIYCLCLSLAIAEININYGELKLQHQDFVSSSEKIIRNYSSRSLRKGLFGYGWCSPFDLKIKAAAKDQIKITTCNDSFNLSLNEFSQDSITKLYTYRLLDNHYQFNKEARLVIAKIAATEYFFSYDRETQKLTSIQSKDKKIKFTLENQLIKSITTKSKTVHYIYSDYKLIEVSINTKINFTYTYDEYANLTYWGQDLVFEKIKYNDEFDLVEYYLQKDKCQNTYEYSRFNKSKFILQNRNCPYSSSQIIKYTFDYQKQQIKMNFIQKPTKLGDLNEKSQTSSTPL